MIIIVAGAADHRRRTCHSRQCKQDLRLGEAGWQAALEPNSCGHWQARWPVNGSAGLCRRGRCCLAVRLTPKFDVSIAQIWVALIMPI